MGLFICRCGQAKEPADYGSIKRYTGETNALGKRHGNGIYMYENGDYYDGEWKWGKKHGYGVYTSSNGEIRRGFYYEDEFIGDNPGQLFAVESNPDSKPAKPLEGTEERRDRESMEAREEKLRLRDNSRKERKQRRDEMRRKYNL